VCLGALAGLPPVHAMPRQVTPPDCGDEQAALSFWRTVQDTAEPASETVDSLAMALVPCLASPNPELRDVIGYGLLTRWLRANALDVETRIQLTGDLLSGLASPHDSLMRSFSALVLSEILRADTNDSFLGDAQRKAIVDTTISRLVLEDDYRGLVAGLGWVHPVAHMADVLWRAALHPACDAATARAILQGVLAQIAPMATSYQFNEPDRLARPVAVIIGRELLPAPELVDWLRRLATRSDGRAWSSAFADPAGMRELGNSKAFARALSDQLAERSIDPVVADQLQALVRLFTQLV